MSNDLKNDPRSTSLDPSTQLELLLDTFVAEEKITKAEARTAKELAKKAEARARKYGGR